MNTKELAEILNGMEYPVHIKEETRTIAEENGLVIVYGASDDLMEFDGAIYDEFGCWDGGTAYLNANGIVENKCEFEECPYYLESLNFAVPIKAVWNGKGNPCWSYRTPLQLPHETFDVIEDGDVYCRGIVFSLTDLRKALEGLR